ncbi:MAG TPA: ribonuclease III [Chitinivibrionales bacterium]
MSRHRLLEFFRTHFQFGKNRSTGSLDLLQESLHYRFSDPAILQQALTHKSCSTPDDKKGLGSNERMEFLGDAVLNCLVTDHLYHLYPNKSEGQLSKVKSLIVSRKILGEIAVSLDLGRYLLVGNSEMKSGGSQQRTSILSNAFEALLGAAYLDGGLEATRQLLRRFLYGSIDIFLSDLDNINYKSRILELSQRDGFGFPNYSVVAASGPDHAKEFRIRIRIAGVTLGEGQGTNKKIAQQNAAREAMEVYSKEFILSHNKGEKNNELVSH